jgi:hypothetical protein
LSLGGDETDLFCSSSAILCWSTTLKHVLINLYML